jgi:ribose 5-phosphate isomerase B
VRREVVAIGADHAGVRTKDALARWLRASGRKVIDAGTHGADSVDYPDLAARVARAVARGRAHRGVLVCGTGIGMAIAANKVRRVRAAVVWSRETARLAAEHNAANVLCLSGRLFPTARLKTFLRTWLTTPFGGGRHGRRVRKIAALERGAA